MPPAEKVLGAVMELIDARPTLRWIHHADGRMVLGYRGFPDLLIFGPHGVICREVKPSQYSQLGPKQSDWRWMIMCNGISWSMWTAEDIASGRIERELDAIA